VKATLLSPEYQGKIKNEAARLLAVHTAGAGEARARLEALDATIANLVEAMASGSLKKSPALAARLAEAEDEKATLTTSLHSPAARVIPRLTERVAGMVRNLERHAAGRSPLEIAQARSDLHEILGDVRVEAEGERPVEVVRGDEVSLLRAAGDGLTDNFGSGGVSWVLHTIEFTDVELHEFPRSRPR
jgi:hypothetical protein